ncbi:hypothetical protein FRC09_008055 [Ceratobasidium sp. 395]|nr:hypothetical protein FRC09_008055 [Ceratobasidium sp. 395]
MDTLDRWLTAESRLTAAVQEFLDCCSALHNVNFDYNENSTVQGELEAKLEQIRTRKPSLVVTQNLITESQTALDAVLARFPPLAAIQRLPIEILSLIFIYATPRLGQWDQWLRVRRYSRLPAILSVCRRWRESAIQTPSLWSYIEFDFTDYGDHPRLPRAEQLWLERSKGSPLHIQFYCLRNEDYGPPYVPRPLALPQMVEALLPYSNHIAALNLRKLEPKYLIETLTRLRLAQSDTNIMTTLNYSGFFNRLSYSSGLVDTQAIAWSSALFRNLSELSITTIPCDQCPTLSEVIKMLSNCPRLYSLQLGLIVVREDIDAQICPRVDLPHLRYLDIRDMRELAQQKLLSVLCPGTSELHLEISPDVEDIRTFTATTDFLTSFLVTSLGLWRWEVDEEYDPPIAPYFSFAQRIHTLILPLQWRSPRRTFESLMNVPDKRDLVPQLPNLKILCLIRGELYPEDAEVLERLTTIYSLDKLVLVGCTPRSSGWDIQAEEQGRKGYYATIERISQKVQVVSKAKGAYSDGESWFTFVQSELQDSAM